MTPARAAPATVRPCPPSVNRDLPKPARHGNDSRQATGCSRRSRSPLSWGQLLWESRFLLPRRRLGQASAASRERTAAPVDGSARNGGLQQGAEGTGEVQNCLDSRQGLAPGGPAPSSWGSRMICMGLTHCPLCVGLAVVAAFRFCAHGWLLVSSGLLQGGAEDFSLGCLRLPRRAVRPDPARPFLATE